MKNNKTIFIVIFSIIVVGIGLYFLNSETTYSAKDVLEGADFNVEETSVNLIKMIADADNTPIDLTKEEQHDLIKSFENSKFSKEDIPLELSNDYLLTITLNGGYVMFLDLDKKVIMVDNNQNQYIKFLVVNDKGFFSILDKAIKRNDTDASF